MRKYMTLLLIAVMLIVPAISIAWLSGQLRGAEDQVEVWQTFGQGDPAALEGIDLQLRSSYSYNLFWETDCRFQGGKETPEAESRFSFSDFRDPYENRYDPDPYSFSLQTLYYDAWRDEALDGEQPGLVAAVQDLAKDTPVGQTRNHTIRIADYYDVYPLRLNAVLPAGSDGKKTLSGRSRVFSDQTAYWAWQAALTPGGKQEIMQALQDYFTIPVLQEEYIKIDVCKTANSTVGVKRVTQSTTLKEHQDLYTANCRCIDAGDAFFFTLSGHSATGKPMDFSRVPGGYGIYRLPYSAEAGLSVNELSTVCSLDPSIDILDFTLSPDGKSVLLYAKETDDIVTLTVLDAETCAVLQKIDFSRVDTADYPFFCAYHGDSYEAVILNRSDLTLLDKGSDGEYQIAFHAPLPKALWQKRELNENDAACRAGDRFLLTGPLCNSPSGYIDFGIYGFYTAVYDKTGLLYYGEYETSLLTKIHGQGSSSWYLQLLPDYKGSGS